MNTINTLLFITIILHSLIVGISYDLSLVKLVARRRVGDGAFATFIRATDLGNGVVAHTLLGGPAILLALYTSGYILVANHSGALRGLALTFGIATFAYALCTAKVVPLTFALKNPPKSGLNRLLDQYAFWCRMRAVFQMVALSFMIWAFVWLAG